MGTTLRAELSEKNPYWIERHRYYELKHFCLQYQIWKKAYAMLGNHIKTSGPISIDVRQAVGDPTAKIAIAKSYYTTRIDMLERVAKQADPIIGTYILKGVTEGMSYDILKARLEIPCCKDVYYELYRKFFWLLDKERA